jgi:UDP-N-acetylmuramate dehydrogenase
MCICNGAGRPARRRTGRQVNPLESVRTHLRRLRSGGEVEVYERVELRAWTTLRVGGVADLMIRCKSVEGVRETIDLLSSHGVRWFVLGAGSRVVAPDEGLRVPVVSLGGELSAWELDPDGAVVGGGASMAQVCQAAIRNGLTRLRLLTAARGTLGGAMARGIDGGSAAAVEWVEVVRPGREPVRRAWAADVAPEAVPGREVVVRARLDGRPLEDEPLVGGSDASLWRAPGFLEPVFRDPPRMEARELLDAAKCRGMAVGGARVCDRDPNRFLTSRRTSAGDVRQLFVAVRARVRKHTDQALEPAALFLDPDASEAIP